MSYTVHLFLNSDSRSLETSSYGWYISDAMTIYRNISLNAANVIFWKLVQYESETNSILIYEMRRCSAYAQKV